MRHGRYYRRRFGTLGSVSGTTDEPVTSRLWGRGRVHTEPPIRFQFDLRTGIPWEYLPQEMGCGSAMTC